MVGFSGRLRDLIEREQMTRKEFAVAVGRSESAVYAWLAGEQSPRLGELFLMREIFGTTYDYLMRGIE